VNFIHVYFLIYAVCVELKTLNFKLILPNASFQTDRQ